MTLNSRNRNRRQSGLKNQQGVSLFELLVAVLLLGMISAMIYSVLNVGITIAAKGEKKILAMEQEQGFLELLHRQVKGAWYDSKQRKIMIRGSEDLLQIFTRQPLLYNRTSGLILAIYRVNPGDNAVYYAEKRDYYNLDYTEEYAPDFDEMLRLYQPVSELAWSFDSETGGLTVTSGEKQYQLFPRCLPEIINTLEP
jgi:prepilin-type N-terminal cleavage/methylation domain-containing protein